MKNLLISILSLTILASCSALDNMESMKETTERLAETSDKMAKTTEELNETGDKTLSGLRSSETKALREEMIHGLKDAINIEDKIPFALAYMKALEFQSWRSAGSDTHDSRESLYEEAIVEFVGKLSGMNILERDPFPINGPQMSDKNASESNKIKAADKTNIGVLVGPMSLVKDSQKVTAKTKKFKTISLYEIVVTSLMQKAHYDAGGAIPKYALLAIERRRELTKAIQFRVNYFMASVAKTISVVLANIETDHKAGKIGPLQKLAAIQELRGLDRSDLIGPSRGLVTKALGSLQAMQVLNRLGVELQLDPKLVAAITKLNALPRMRKGKNLRDEEVLRLRSLMDKWGSIVTPKEEETSEDTETAKDEKSSKAKGA